MLPWRVDKSMFIIMSYVGIKYAAANERQVDERGTKSKRLITIPSEPCMETGRS